MFLNQYKNIGVNIRYANPLAAAIASSIVGITLVIIKIIKKTG